MGDGTRASKMLKVVVLVPVNVAFHTVVPSLFLGPHFSPGSLLPLCVFLSSSFFTHVLNIDIPASSILDSENDSFPLPGFS